MNTPVKVATFLAALGVLLGAGWVVGAAAGPVGTTASKHGDDMSDDMSGAGHAGKHSSTGDSTDDTDTSDGSEDDMDAHPSGTAMPGGLAIAQDGYRLVLSDTQFPAGQAQLQYRVLDKHGKPLTDYQTEHTKQMHLIVVRRDFAGFQHVHPVLDKNTGLWSAPAQLSAGSWRMFADFTATGGPALTLGADINVAGTTTEAQPEPVTRSDTVAGDLTSGSHSMLKLTVTRDGQPVRTLQPYLGAFGHLVALREGDLAYLHVHPTDDAAAGTVSGPTIEFGTEVPSAGRYHLYLDFQVDGVVRTAHFILDAD